MIKQRKGNQRNINTNLHHACDALVHCIGMVQHKIHCQESEKQGKRQMTIDP